jgi:hypothetical protein
LSLLQFLNSQLYFYFYGFGIVYGLLFLFRKIDKLPLMEAADKILPIAGLLYLFFALFYYGIDFFIGYYSGATIVHYAFINTTFNTFYLAVVYPIMFMFIPSQLFWFQKVKESKWIKFILSFFFIFSFERIYIFFSSFHRDYLPSSWTICTDDFLGTIVYSVLLFLFLTAFYHYRNFIINTFRAIF